MFTVCTPTPPIRRIGSPGHRGEIQRQPDQSGQQERHEQFQWVAVLVHEEQCPRLTQFLPERHRSFAAKPVWLRGRRTGLHSRASTTAATRPFGWRITRAVASWTRSRVRCTRTASFPRHSFLASVIWPARSFSRPRISTFLKAISAIPSLFRLTRTSKPTASTRCSVSSERSSAV